MYTVISPILTEKSAQGMDSSLYVLSITDYATKNSIRDDLKKLFNVEVTGVRIVNLPAKQTKFRGVKGKRNARRKAYVQLKTGQHLPGFEVKKETEKEDKAKKTKEEPKETK